MNEFSETERRERVAARKPKAKLAKQVPYHPYSFLHFKLIPLLYGNPFHIDFRRIIHRTFHIFG